MDVVVELLRLGFLEKLQLEFHLGLVLSGILE